jgi:hypothetical protein
MHARRLARQVSHEGDAALFVHAGLFEIGEHLNEEQWVRFVMKCMSNTVASSTVTP